MSSRNVAIRKDVYDALRREKRPQESFTKLFNRLLNQKGPLQELAGAWPRGPVVRSSMSWAKMRGLAERPSRR